VLLMTLCGTAALLTTVDMQLHARKNRCCRLRDRGGNLSHCSSSVIHHAACSEPACQARVQIYGDIMWRQIMEYFYGAATSHQHRRNREPTSAERNGAGDASWHGGWGHGGWGHHHRGWGGAFSAAWRPGLIGGALALLQPTPTGQDGIRRERVWNGWTWVIRRVGVY
jgi:hypothetical protein